MKTLNKEKSKIIHASIDRSFSICVYLDYIEDNLSEIKQKEWL